MLDSKKHDNQRYTFLVKLTHHTKAPSPAFISAMTTLSRATLMVFGSSENTWWLHIACDPLGNSLSRHFISGAANKGYKAIAAEGFA